MAVVAGAPPARVAVAARVSRACIEELQPTRLPLQKLSVNAPSPRRADCGGCVPPVDKKYARFLKHLVEFLRAYFSHRVKDDVLFDGEQSLRTNEAGLRELIVSRSDCVD
jgi:hypothetical protein